ncbi:unnamed protein product [Prorocentrum cordatum]|uniref:Ribosome biogenesis protein NOP53 n=1 Tax=Prorocentrum cordatum TaxID=2364126 RepID=A0ABN9TRA2_9DINO|nr:unnamed protein product [Polarella glacialis]
MAAKKGKKKGTSSKSSRTWSSKSKKNKTKYRPQDPVFNRMGGIDDGHNQAPKGDADLAGIPELRAEALPKQRPGESARAYSARLGKAAEKQLKEARRKLNTDHHREKKRKRAQDKKKAAEEKRRTRAGAGEQEESRQQARFGDIVHRPPIMSSAALKSRSSLKAQAKVPEGARSGGDLGAYADKVREAYAALRKRRLGEG